MRKSAVIAAAAALLASLTTGVSSKVKWQDVQETVSKAKDLKEELHLGRDNERKLGREVSAYLIAKYGLYDDQDSTRYVGLVGKTVARRTGRNGGDYRFGILNTKAVNAYSTPGGIIFVTKGLLMRLQDESQLAGVLAHEIVHVDQKHAIKGFVKAKALGEVAKKVSDKSAFDEAARQLIEGIAEKGFPRADEYAADKGALGLLRAAGYAPHGLDGALQRLYGGKEESQDLLKSWKSMHPPLSDRLERLDKLLENVPPDGATLKKRFRDATTF
ncbi:MAG: hypothetical protein A2X36_04210 [Elusimicrobia bacterium GWA2_69_24]|nr:MAG: hypothetical protein A2X36_04210 [Elusimicrobia bacterium GWA2_69_24]